MRADTVLGRRADLVPAAVLRLASDERLAEQVRAGSERAFEALFDRHHRPVLAFCRHMLGSREEAEDVVQLTFLAAYRDLVRTAPPFALRPWLYGIARHRCLSVLRARRERPVDEVPEPAADQLATEIATRENLRALLADLARLPHDQRAALILAEMGDVSHHEIARILACPRPKVKALVFQARSSLTAARAARETPCAEIRQHLATLRGGALLRAILRRHLHDCPGCQAFRDQLRSQRRVVALLLPVTPTVGLKRAVLGALFGTGGGAGGAAVTAATLSAGGLAATALVALAIPAGGITAAVSASRDGGQEPRMIARAARGAAPASALPRRAGAKPAPGERERNHPSATAAKREPTHPREPPAQTEANAKSGYQPEPANSPGPAQPGKPAEAAKPLEPATAGGQLTAADATGPTESPRANRQVGPDKPTEPTEPPKANGELAQARPVSGQPPEAAEPGEPPNANGHATPTRPAEPAKPPQVANAVERPGADGRATPGRSADPARPPQAADPAEPPQASRHVTPGRPADPATPPEAPRPAGPPSAKGEPTPAGPAQTPEGDGQVTPAKPDGHAAPELPPTLDTAHRPDESAKATPIVAPAPRDSATAINGGNEHEPANG